MWDHQRGLPREKKGSIDAVFVGGSNVHAFWQPLLAWTDHGISSYNYSVDSVPMGAVRYLIAEARKTQPDALYVITLNSFKRNSAKKNIENTHRAVDYLPLSLNKIRMINDLADISGLTGAERAELFFPIIRFHSRWDSLAPWSLGVRQADYKSSMTEGFFLRNVEDITDQFFINEDTGTLPEDVARVFDDQLDDLEQTHANVLFVKVPQATERTPQAQMNELKDVVAKRGFPCLDLMEAWLEVGINTHLDFYNYNHTNIHGSLKVVEFICNYFAENYDFEDKRGKAGWEDWDRAAADYMELVGAYALPFETEHARRIDTVSPALKKAKVKGRSITVTWKEIEDIDGYEIYRKSNRDTDRRWQFIAGVGADSTSCRDDGLEASTKYTYTVVPWRMAGGEKLYGDFVAAGISNTTPDSDGTESGKEGVGA